MADGAARQLHGRATAAIFLAVTIGLAAVSWATQRAFESRLNPELLRKAQTVGVSVVELVSRAMHYGFALPELYGVDESFATTRRKHPELGYLAVRDREGRQLFASGQVTESAPGVALPIRHEGEMVGRLAVGIDPGFVRAIAQESLLDILAVLVVALFLTRELLAFMSGPLLETQLSQAATLTRLRAPLFLFMLAEELTRPFLPAHAKALYVALPGLSAQVAIGLPIVAFMLVVALGQPVLGMWADRIGHRRTMQIGSVLAMLGLGASALSHTLYELIAWRALCGLGYATVFVAGQAYVLAHTAAHERSRGFALFVGAIMAAAVCGPPIGGILADHLGARWSFAVAGTIALSALLAVSGLPAHESRPDSREKVPGLGDFVRLLANRRFLTVSVLAAVPAKLILAGFCFYLVPLYVGSLGATPSAAGRALMVYAASLVLVLPQAARLAERGLRHEQLVLAGLCISGGGGLVLLVQGGLGAVYFSMLLLGLGQGLSIAAQSSLVAELCGEAIRRHGSGPVYGVYRLVERLGNAGGPLLAGLLVASLDYRGAFAAIGTLVLASGFLFALGSGALRRPVPARGN